MKIELPAELPEKAVRLAGDLLEESRRFQTRPEKARAEQLRRMLGDPEGKLFTQALADQVFRFPSSRRGAEQFRHLLDQFGAPAFLRPAERLALTLAGLASRLVPWVVMPAVRAKVRRESRSVVLPAETRPLLNYLDARRSEGSRVNLNLLGEAVLGEAEAARRLGEVNDLLQQPDVAYVSIKISAIFSQINVLDFRGSLEEVKVRLRNLYRVAQSSFFRHSDGRESPKFVNLDMEEYRDLELTLRAFCEVLEEVEFQNLTAGIVLQAYLPDSFEAQRRLTEWARRRVEKGGAAVKLRIVKGANLAMEQVEAATHGWPQAPFDSKADVDANYKRMIGFGMQPENAAAVTLGIGSHNLFDLAWALLLRQHFGVESAVEFEMLEGMANHQAAALSRRAGGVLFYAPIVYRRNFVSAISYLVRRLDENTAPENFLRDLFGLETGSTQWEDQRERFLTACHHQNRPAVSPRRTQNRSAESRKFDPDDPFANEPDTDWSLKQNRDWIAPILDSWEHRRPPDVPLQIGGKEIPGAETAEGFDPSRPEAGAVYRFGLADGEQVGHSLDSAVAAQRAWAEKTLEERRGLLVRVAEVIAENRGEAIGCMVLDAGKAVREADAEVSEAVDFANYYARGLDFRADTRNLAAKPRGVVVVAPPWNFPFAIPASGVLAALMAGNAVILKPAPEAVLTAWSLARYLWDAGVPRDVLQFVACPDNETGRMLITDERTSAVVLTGAYATARMFLDWKPELRLFAETSGKNALFISSAADADLAIHDLVRSAFGHSGQKCSAASLALVEDELYDTKSFHRQLRDAAESLPVGSAWHLKSVVTPLIRPPAPELRRGLTELDKGETWLLEPREIHPQLWSPGIRLGVTPGSWFHQTECFGPVLGVMRVRDLDEALAIQNGSEFALTAGIHSLDRREVEKWRESIEAGNAYTNRRITGAIVRRQPFGGWKHSAIGPGAKAGGPNYVASFCEWGDAERSRQSRAVGAAENEGSSDRRFQVTGDFSHWWHQEFENEHDPSQVRGERNLFRYRPCRGVLVRFEDEAWESEMSVIRLAAHLCGTRVSFSIPGPKSLSGAEGDRFVENTTSFLSRLPERASAFERLRMPRGATAAHFRAAIENGLFLDDSPVLTHGRIELLKYLREQSVSDCMHRYGNPLPPEV